MPQYAPEDYKPIRLTRLEQVKREQIYWGSRVAICREEGLPGYQYLTAERGLDVQTIANFRLGYVPFSVDNEFRGRIVMPIFDAYGNLIALSFRPLADVKPKYWNESFVKGDVLYGMSLAKYSICKFGFAIVVEGQLDVCLMHSYGFTNTVGLMGGVLTPIQAQQLCRWTREAVLMMDGDVAGRGHTQRAKEVLDYFQYSPLKNLRSFSYVIADLPEKEEIQDPAKFLRRLGGLEMRKLLLNAMTLSGMNRNVDKLFPKEKK